MVMKMMVTKEAKAKQTKEIMVTKEVKKTMVMKEVKIQPMSLMMKMVNTLL